MQLVHTTCIYSQWEANIIILDIFHWISMVWSADWLTVAPVEEQIRKLHLWVIILIKTCSHTSTCFWLYSPQRVWLKALYCWLQGRRVENRTAAPNELHCALKEPQLEGVNARDWLVRLCFKPLTIRRWLVELPCQSYSETMGVGGVTRYLRQSRQGMCYRSNSAVTNIRMSVWFLSVCWLICHKFLINSWVFPVFGAFDRFIWDFSFFPTIIVWVLRMRLMCVCLCM